MDTFVNRTDDVLQRRLADFVERGDGAGDVGRTAVLLSVVPLNCKIDSGVVCGETAVLLSVELLNCKIDNGIACGKRPCCFQLCLSIAKLIVVSFVEKRPCLGCQVLFNEFQGHGRWGCGGCGETAVSSCNLPRRRPFLASLICNGRCAYVCLVVGFWGTAVCVVKCVSGGTAVMLSFVPLNCQINNGIVCGKRPLVF